jgi:hypothetical protein
MSKKNLFSLLLVVAVLVLMSLACDGTGGGTLVIDQAKVADTILEHLDRIRETASEIITGGRGVCSHDASRDGRRTCP